MRELIKLEGLSREDWLAIRRTGIGGSDVSAIMGLNKYKSALELYLDKTGQLPDPGEENIAAELGLELEDFLAKKFVSRIKKNEELDIVLIKPKYMYQHDKIDYFYVNFDRLILTPDGYIPVELKTTTEYKREDWKDDNIPDEYYMQVQWQMMIAEADYAYIVYLIGNRTLDYKKIPRNEKMIKEVVKEIKHFWNDFRLKGIPPAPDGTLSARDALNILYADDKSDEPLDLTEELALDYAAYKELANKIKADKFEQDKIKQKFMALMGNNTFATITIDGKVKKIRYRNIDRAGYTVEPKTLKQFNIY